MKNLKKAIIPALVIIVVLESVFLILAYRNNLARQHKAAETYGTKIAACIKNELTECEGTTLLIEDLYKVYGDTFLSEFEVICEEFTKDHIAIGSMYFAPGGVIKYAYPDEIDEATEQFEMLKDPIQGPKSQKAYEDGVPTIAGPHNLIEGGVGFIIRNPIYKDGEFVGFAIIVLDRDIFVQEALKRLGDDDIDYNFAVWKEPDDTAVYDENHYIFTNCEKKLGDDVVIDFKAPNDIWHLSIEPVNGWNPWPAMIIEGVASILLALLLILGVIATVYRSEMAKERRFAQQEEENNAKLQVALEKAQAANQAKTMFLFAMSHDIRTPMNAIIGFTDLVEQNLNDKDKCEDYIHKMKSSNAYLMSLLNNVLEMSRIEKGDIELEESAFLMEHMVNTLESVFEQEMEEKEIKYSIVNHVKHPCFYCDETKLREVYLNIISNAMKYTHEGGSVTVKFEEREHENPDYIWLDSTVTDNGIGISKEFLPKAFETFTREKTVTENKIQGSGLGLSIVKRFVSMMRGSVRIESIEGEGTTVYLSIPFRKASREELPEHYMEEEVLLPETCEGKKILLVEDNELNREIAMSILEDEGFIIDTAEDGAIAVEKMRSATPGQYDLILMDIQMPNMNGYDATRNIRSLENPELANIPIVAMTANAFDEDRKNAFDAGMNGFVAKPIDIPILFETLGEVL